MPWLQPGGTLGATSFYDTKSLRDTLERLVDFDRINAGITRFSAGAVNVRTGNFAYFDSTTHTIRPEHVIGQARRFHQAFHQSRSMASSTGMAASCPTRRCSG